MKQIYHNYKKWEEYPAGMWRAADCRERKRLINRAIKFMNDTEKFGNWMIKVVESWKFSCEQNLTCQSINKQAWIGQAACCLSTGLPASVTRFAWRFLSREKQERANKMADVAISAWESKQRKNIHCQLDLFGEGWDAKE